MMIFHSYVSLPEGMVCGIIRAMELWLAGSYRELRTEFSSHMMPFFWDVPHGIYSMD